MSDVARLIAVADLLVDEGRLLDRAGIAESAAEQVARLARAGYAHVVLAGPDGAVDAAYPGASPVGDFGLEARIDGSSTVGSVRVAEPIDGSFSHLDAWLVEVVARRIESQLAVVDLHESKVSQAEVVRDAELAGELQRALVSAERCATPRAVASGRLLPARRVGGDLFDLIEVDGGLLAVVLDVSGKGAAASLLTAAVLSSVHHHAREVGVAPADVLQAVDASMAPMLDRTGRLVTLAVAGVTRRGGEVRIASAGHHPVLVRAADGAEAVPPTAPPLGVVRPGTDEAVVDFPEGASILMASDGIVDQRNPLGVPFGMDRLGALLDTRFSAPESLVRRVLDDVDTFAAGMPQDDDQALVVVTSEGGLA